MIRKNYYHSVLVGLAVLLTIGCSKVEDLYNPNADLNQKPESDFFDFQTTRTAKANLNYGALAGNALIEVFDHNPVIANEKEQSYTLDSEALYKLFLDENGTANQSITLPAGVSKVWLYSHNWTTPLIVEADYNNGVISYSTETRTSLYGTRASTLNSLKSELKYTTLDAGKRLYSIVSWGKYGKSDDTEHDMNGLYSEGDLTSTMINNLQHSLWNGQNNKPTGLDNSRYCVDTDVINTYIAKEAKDENNETHTIESAKVWLTVVAEGAWDQNAFGYYFYKDGETPRSAAEVDKFVIVPNYSVPNLPPFGGAKPTYNASLAPIKSNLRIQLLFKNEKGEMVPDFPAGYHIGYFILVNAFNCNNGTLSTSPSKGSYYSNKEWNSDKRSHCIGLQCSSGGLVYGFEDSTSDNSLEDALFTITANPNYAIDTPDLPTIDTGEVKVPDAIQTTCSTYAFEDMWPTGGDYDLNDVMVEHTCKVTSNVSSKGEYIKKIEDIFTFVQPADAATYTDAFAVQYNSAQKGTMTLPESAIDETETGSIIICENVKGNLKKSFTVTRTFDGESLLKKDLITDLNPFIISQYKKGEAQRVEVHLPKHKATSKADQSLNNHKDDAYYINKGGMYPFAISIPKSGFTPSTEKSPIDVEYTEFDKWVTSGGTQSTDWYNHYTKK